MGRRDSFDAGILSSVVQDERAWDVAMGVAARTGLIATLDGRRQWWRMHHLCLLYTSRCV